MEDDLVPHTFTTYKANELTPGFKGRRISFEHKPYEKRSEAARASYDELRVSLIEHGMTNHLITYQGHVLIGQRRYEIMCERGMTMFPCIEIQEDVSEWWRDGTAKLDALKARYYA